MQRGTKLKLHPEGSDLKKFPSLKTNKQYQVWTWWCEDDWCNCQYIQIMEADSFESKQIDYYVTRAINGREVWQGTWTSNDFEHTHEVLEAERKAAEEYINDFNGAHSSGKS